MRVFIDKLNFASEQPVELTTEDGKLIIKKAEIPRKNIHVLFADYSGDFICSEIDWGDRVGNEVW